jgi:parallel beta-helix repeat protein
MTIQNQRIQKTGTGIILVDCNNCIVTGNDVIESTGGLILSNSNNNNISYNDFYQNKNFGIKLYGSDYNIIEHNLCMENTMGEFSYHGISISGSDNNTIKNNIIEQNNVGIECSRSFDNIITNNGIRYNHYTGIKFDSSSENNLINYNSIIGNDRGVILIDVGFNSIIKNNFIDNDMIVEVIQYYKLRLNRLPHISGNYWGKARILPKFIPGKFTFIWMDVPWGGGITINWIYFDWHPAKEPYDI